MTGVVRLTVSVPAELLAAVDQRLVKDGNRSGLVRQLFERALREVTEREQIEQYIRGYREQPQTEEEFGWHDQAAREGLAALPWE